MNKSGLEVTADFFAGIKNAIEYNGWVQTIGFVGGTMAVGMGAMNYLDYDFGPTPDGAHTVMNEMQLEMQTLKPYKVEVTLAEAALDRAEADYELAELKASNGQSIDIAAYEQAIIDATRELGANRAEFNMFMNDYTEKMFSSVDTLGEQNIDVLKSEMIAEGYDTGKFNLDFNAATLSGCDTSGETANAVAINSCALQNTELEESRWALFMPGMLGVLLFGSLLSGVSGSVSSSLRKQARKTKRPEN